MNMIQEFKTSNFNELCIFQLNGKQKMTENPINTFVAMFDFLGFKMLRKERGTLGLYNLYLRGLLPQIQHSAALNSKVIEKNGVKISVPDPRPYSIDYRIISDSIILFSPSNSFNDFLGLITASHQLLCTGFAGHKAPLRGAIGYGDLILDNRTIWLGSAIEDAYIGESTQLWAGCSITPNCQSYLEEHNFIEKYKVVFKDMAIQEQDQLKKNEY